MSININSRKKRFIQDLMDHLAMRPDGSSRYRKKVKIALQNIADDLAYLDELPMRLKNLSPEAVIKLVTYWKEMKLRPKTIKNKLGVLRGLLSKIDKPILIPTNKELGVITRRTILKPQTELIDPYAIPPYPVFLIKEVCIFQYLFGLKLYEAIKIDSSMIHDTYLEIHHSISFNKKDRRILIESAEQKEFIKNFRTNLKGMLPITNEHYPCFIALYQHIQKQLKINHEDYFRHRYIRSRYQELLLKCDSFEALETVKAEVGYSKVGQIKGVLACQEGF